MAHSPVKKGFGLLLVVSAGLYGKLSSDTALDPNLLRVAEHELHAHRGVVHNTRLTIIDYRKSVLQTRLWVVDTRTQQVVLASRVSHSFKSGLVYARVFSNTIGSEKSCTGSFVTGKTYTGRFGYALRVRGLDASNSNTLSRSIVFHNAPYFIPYTAGCFATNVNTELIHLIRNGSFVYVVQ